MSPHLTRCLAATSATAVLIPEATALFNRRFPLQAVLERVLITSRRAPIPERAITPRGAGEAQSARNRLRARLRHHSAAKRVVLI
jgi:hypothetical protein